MCLGSLASFPPSPHWQHGPVEFHDTKSAKELFDVNVLGTLRLTQKMLRESSTRHTARPPPLSHTAHLIHVW